MSQGVVREAWALFGRGRADDALALTTRTLAAPSGAAGPDAALLIVHAAALKVHGRHAEALSCNQQAVERTPNDPIAWYNLAATLGDLGRASEGEAAVRRAIDLGLAAPEARLVLARALQSQRRYDEAQQAYLEAIGLRPGYVDAHRDLAQLRWMSRGDLAFAAGVLREAVAGSPGDPRLAQILALVEESAGEPRMALATARRCLTRHPDDGHLLLVAAHLASQTGEAEAGLAYARAAERLAPDFPPVLQALAEAQLALGDAAGASRIAERLRAMNPNDQHAIAVQSTAWRLAGDPRHAWLEDHAAVVRAYDLPTPEGWSSQAAFLADLRTRLAGLHDLKAHPFEQSLRGGTQAQSLHTADDPVFRAFFASARAVVARYLDEIGSGDDPLRARVGGGFRIQGGWSVSLRPNGFHTDHIHPQGWISSAFYIDVPTGADDPERREGWIKFGQPGCATTPPLEPEHEVRPRPGTLVLFPSYMWHGTRGFTSDERRLTMAFDVVPD
jgi:tetratricopeptide (TPR) repeat protein